MTVAELIAYLQQLPQDAVVVLPTHNDRADAFCASGMCCEPRAMQLRQTYTNGAHPRPRALYEIDGEGAVAGVLLE